MAEPYLGWQFWRGTANAHDLRKVVERAVRDAQLAGLLGSRMADRTGHEIDAVVDLRECSVTVRELEPTSPGATRVEVLISGWDGAASANILWDTHIAPAVQWGLGLSALGQRIDANSLDAVSGVAAARPT